MSDTPPTKNDLAKIASLIGIIVLVVLGFYIINFAPFIPNSIKGLLGGLSDNRGDWGTFGDYVGGTLNPLFGFFGFITLLVTVALQRNQLDEQRKDMEQQRKEAADAYKLQLQQIEAQRQDAAANQKALDEAHETQQLQQFESTFFILFDKMEGCLYTLQAQHYPIPVSYAKVKNKPLLIRYIHSQIDNPELRDRDTDCSLISEKLASPLSHANIYFEFLYHTLKLINSKKIPNKDYYIGLLKDFLEDELKLLLALYVFNLYVRTFPPTELAINYKKLLEEFTMLNGVKKLLIDFGFERTLLYKELTTHFASNTFEKSQTPTD